MFYQKYPPGSALIPFVECFFLWQSEEEGERCFESPPSGFCSIVFNLGDPYFIENSKHRRLQLPARFVAGQAIYSYKLQFYGRIAQAGIVFKPAGLSTIFDLAMFPLVEERMPLESLLSPEKTAAITKRLEETESADQKIGVLRSFMQELLLERKPVSDQIDVAANQIVQRNGIVRIDQLLENSFMTRRTFERRFLYKVGLSPKYYARVRRISYLCNLIAGNAKVDWQQVLHDCEYFDQAHFIRDFESFTGRSPQNYLKDNAELKRFLADRS